MIWWTKTGFGYKAVCEVRSRHWLVIGQCGETLVNTRFCARPRVKFSVRRYLVIEFRIVLAPATAEEKLTMTFIQ